MSDASSGNGPMPVASIGDREVVPTPSVKTPISAALFSKVLK